MDNKKANSSDQQVSPASQALPPLGRCQADSLDEQVNDTLQGSWLGLFLTDLAHGVGYLALLQLLLEAIWEWDFIFSRPDVYVLSIAAVGQSAWLARRQHKGLALPWWSRLVGMVGYVLVESLIEGGSFFDKPKHVTFVFLMLLYAWGAALEQQNDKPARAITGVCLSRTAQALGPLLFYIALDVRGVPWFAGVSDFFTSAPHTFLLALALTSVGSLISGDLVKRRQQMVIANLLHQLKTLSRWGFGSHVVEEVLRDSGTHQASRVERAIGFIDIRGFTAWSETREPEEVITMLNRFYAAVLDSCGAGLIKSKMNADEVLLVMTADEQAIPQMQKALGAAIAAMQPASLSAGAGLWLGPVVEGFFGTQTAQVHDVIGDTVNTASRLCNHALGGQLLVGPVASVRDAAQEQIELRAKGKTEPVRVAVYRVS
jgi:class 3 adenylate cyclase